MKRKSQKQLLDRAPRDSNSLSLSLFSISLSPLFLFLCVSLSVCLSVSLSLCPFLFVSVSIFLCLFLALLFLSLSLSHSLFLSLSPSLSGDTGVFYAGSTLPPLPQVVRVGDVIKDFRCVFSTRRSVGIKYSWVHKNNPDILECTQNCTLPVDERSSSRVEYYVRTEILSPEENSSSSCQIELSDKFLLKVVPLTIHGVTINDTGEYYCQASYLVEGENWNFLKSKVEKITVGECADRLKIGSQGLHFVVGFRIPLIRICE